MSSKDTFWHVKKYTPFRSATKAPTYTPKPSEPASKQHLRVLKGLRKKNK